VQEKGHAIDAKAQQAGCNQVPVGKMGFFFNVLLTAHVRFDERDVETEPKCRRATSRLYNGFCAV